VKSTQLEFKLFFPLVYINTPVKTVITRGLGSSVLVPQFRPLGTVSLAIFNSVFEIFYAIREGKLVNIVPINILVIIHPIVLAFIIIGDGNFHQGYIIIYLNAFTY
jgi:uncharacterized membrane protein